eukprot:TRINITY_DN14680_c0_g1_i10.p1 TRINITY_DN14680_c0_g1~~TRINITY_DN14680_c0_g1_i10.p1  ORF type:complete len:465 (+),score=94.20 TRINITY_DN14680_c0_g1_i10:86-1480(+)
MGASCCGSVEDPSQSAAVQHRPVLPAAGVAGAEGPAAARAYLTAREEAIRAGLLKEEARVRALLAAVNIPEAAGRAGIAGQEELGRAFLAAVRQPESSERSGVLACEETEREEILKARASARKDRLSRKQTRRRRQQRWNARHREQLAQQGVVAESAPVAASSSPEVRLLVYSLHVGYHSGVEVFGKEYFFGGTYSANSAIDLTRSGIQICRPRRGPFGNFKEVVSMGLSPLDKSGITRIIAEMTPDWSLGSYHLLQRNCNNFAEALLARIGCPGRPPEWVNAAARCAAICVPVALFDWVARRVGMQKRRPVRELAFCSCGARFGICTHRTYCPACAMPHCKECISGCRVVPLHGPRPVQVCRHCAEPPPAVAAGGSAAAPVEAAGVRVRFAADAAPAQSAPAAAAAAAGVDAACVMLPPALSSSPFRDAAQRAGLEALGRCRCARCSGRATATPAAVEHSLVG